MRDHPNHGSKILGGLWGGFNYKNFKLAVKARSNLQHQHCDHCRRHISSPVKINTISREALYSVPSSSQYGYDLDILERRVWPLIRCIKILINLVSGECFHLFAATSVIHDQLCRGRSLIHDSYRCATPGGLSP